MSNELRFWVGGGVIALAGMSQLGCTEDFSKCAETRTCPKSRHDGGNSETPDGATRGGGAGGAAVGTGGSVGVAGAGGMVGVVGAGGDGAGSGGVSGSAGGSPADAGAPIDSGAAGDAGRITDAAADSSLSCPPGFADCNRVARDGCEVELATSAAHCGACDTACSPAGTTMAPTCVTSVCSKPNCDTTHLDCNLKGADGCEVDKMTDAKNCGACGHVCSTNGASMATCVAGVCTPACLQGRGDCKTPASNLADDGCEVDKTTDAKNCGACGHACASTNLATPPACAASVCKPAKCVDGFADCKTPASTAADDGCEANLNQTPTCGSCGHDCQGGQCSARACQPVTLESGLTAPSGLAVDSSGIYWTDEPASGPRVMRAPTAGVAARIAPERAVSGSGNPLVANGTYVVYATENTGGTNSPNGKLRRVQSGTNNVVDIDTNIAADDIGINATHAFYFDPNQGHMHQVALNGSGSLDLSSMQTFDLAMQADATNVYFLSSFNSVAALRIANGAVTTLKPDSPAIYSFRLTADATNLFTWSAASEILRIPKTLQSAPTVVANADSKTGLAEMAADGSFVYVAQSDGVYRVATTGGTPVLLAPASDFPVRIVVFGGAVYWIDADQIKRLAVFSN